MCTLHYVTSMTHLKTCLKTSEFKQLLEQLKETMTPKPSVSFLESKECENYDVYTIDGYTQLFDKI